LGIVFTGEKQAVVPHHPQPLGQLAYIVVDDKTQFANRFPPD
jgi:hypothetical protein